MKKQIQRTFLLLIMLFAMASQSWAYDAEVGGIYYNFNKTNKTAAVASGNYSGYINITIPSMFVYSGTTYNVTSIGYDAFEKCSKLTSITIPNSVTSIGGWAFSNCSGLTSINIPNSVTNIGSSAFYNTPWYNNQPDGLVYAGLVAYDYKGTMPKNANISIKEGTKGISDKAFYSCSGLTSITIPNSVTNIGERAFDGCSGLTSITIPNSVTSIENYAFRGCSGLISINVDNNNSQYVSENGILYNKEKTILIQAPAKGIIGSITIPNSVTSIGDCAFLYCSGLTSITIPNSVTSIGSYAFSHCSGLTSITIPNSVTSIGTSAFSSCSGLTSITIPNSVTSIGTSAFSSCDKLKSLVIEGRLSSYNDVFTNLSNFTVIYANEKDISSIKRYNFDFCGTVLPIGSYFFSIKRNLSALSFKWSNTDLALVSIKFGDNELKSDKDGWYKLTGLSPDTEYNIDISYKTDDGELHQKTIPINTNEPSFSINCSSAQATLTISMSASADESASPTKMFFTCNGKEYNYTGSPVKVIGLKPNSQYKITPGAYYGTKKIYGYAYTFKTLPLDPTLSIVISPTGFVANGINDGDAKIVEAGFVGYDEGNTLNVFGLEPSTKYTLTYYVKDENGNREETSQTFKTKELELKTLDPKVVSNSCAIVAASTNISEDEPNVGFQWKKVDAPASLKPSEGYAAVYGSQLEGYIKNLQSTSYYNVRAFYKTTAGKYYYGDWITFDPSDFSFFEPTVHTYPVQSLAQNSVKLKGYVMAGTDKILEQGFQYWTSNSSKSSARYVRATETTNNDVTTVLSSGQVMTVVLKDLLSSSTYYYRAFVKTESGIKYGEEQTFETEDLTGIGDVEADHTAPTIVGYYDMNGRKIERAGKGISIVRYSDGSVRKVMTK